MIRSLVFVGCLTIAASATAQKASTWAKEPSTVFGVPIGKTLGNERVSMCGGERAQESANPVSVCAMQRPGSGGFAIAGFDTPLFESGFINREDEIVNALMITAKHSSYQDVKALLLSKYGRPTTRQVDTLQNGMGARFTSERLRWQGKNISLSLEERTETPSETRLLFIDNVYSRKKASERRDALSEGASKM